MLNTKFQASEPSGSGDEDFLIFPMYFYGSNLGPPDAGPFRTLRPWFEQIWYRTTRQCYIPNFQYLRQVVLKKKIFEYFPCISVSNLGFSGAGPFWTPGLSFEQTW